MRSLIVAALLQILSLSYGQQNVRLYSEQTEEGFSIYADNDEYCPVSVELQYELTNVRHAGKDNGIVVLPMRSYRVKIADLNVIRRGKSTGVRYAIKANFGDHYLSTTDHTHIYHLPYAEGQSFTVGQGYNGSFSHGNENALDFNMPVGTPIHAARGGIISKVVESNDRRCPQPECYKFNNYIRVYHADGTFAEYAHIKKNGALVEEGEEIATGQLLGYSGDVGWASGPHLHFMVYVQRMERRETLKTLFHLGKDRRPEYLVERRSYRREQE